MGMSCRVGVVAVKAWGIMAADGMCPITGEPLRSGEFVSQSAVNRLRVVVSDLPQLMGDLDYALAGLSHGDPPGGGGASSKEPLNLALALEVWDMQDAVNVWACELASWVMGPKYFVKRGNWCAVRETFRQYADVAKRWVQAPAFVDEVVYAVHRLERLASPCSQALVFAGRCAECGTDLLVERYVDAAVCRSCGARSDVEESRQAMLDAIATRPFPRARAVEVAQILTGRVIPDATVRSWCHRGKLHAVEGVGPRLYRPGDIAALVDTSG
ncbi:helix-turn-helix domain-containing protein [Schaalia sp. lx-260]|uniref:helix-turn-helix domain-containing protein n=1 Tax=Schaalia sp. lx-260 TaxID=2899082 RepID=UPI001E518653|nr:helix-turn-helix domain-containing protein [Schaalia sp. lx-260]MCD4549689.1 helix-turn-helix domain-containing protein [Schaalia sp. lx-260]